ncbi:DUF5906 domain-containing protein [Alteromonas mediterranea]|uniref:DUF5906 domain-containing protein n=1 Tax=Alteromonas mediterranea TaxID=314275 RepID=UPI0032B222AB
MNFLNEHGHSLVELGYEIVPIKKGEKFPTLRGWQDVRATKTCVDKWLGNGHAEAGVGILCRNTVAVDIDCLNAKINYDLLHWLKENVAESPVRAGQKPKCIAVFRVEDGFKKIKSAEYEDTDGRKHAVEVLADGQQFVAFGIHPKTQKPYNWVKGSLLNTPQNKLPTITQQQAEKFVEYFEQLAGQQDGWVRVSARSKPQDQELHDLLTFKQKLDISDESVRELIMSRDPDCHHDEWIKVGMGLHHQFDGEDEGWHLWDEWSSAGSKYREGECERRYATFEAKGRVPITLASVKAMEREEISEEHKEELLPMMLREWAFVQVEGSARVVRENLTKDQIVLYKDQDLKKEHMNCRVLSDGEKPKLVNLVDLWLEHPERRTYAAGLTFAPDMETLNRYNLWRGWSVEGCEGNVDPWLDYVLNVVADGNQVHANYIIAWAAQIIQKPMTKVGVGLVLRGRKGTGKTKFGELLGGLFHAHHKIVSRSEHVTGNFNRHLEDTLLLQADEAYWAGAKASEGALKDILTNPKITIERKGVDAYTAPNYTRILFTSNEDYVVPATLDERRFAVFDVSTCRQQDSKYFSALDNWYENEGGAAALIHYLRSFDGTKINLRLVPQTDALTDQKLEALDTVNQWLFNALMNGEFREHRVLGEAVEFGTCVAKAELYEIYVSSVRSNKFEVPVKENIFWKTLKHYGDLFADAGQKGSARTRMVKINGVEAGRFAFEAVNNLNNIQWVTMNTAGAPDDPFDPDNWDEE